MAERDAQLFEHVRVGVGKILHARTFTGAPTYISAIAGIFDTAGLIEHEGTRVAAVAHIVENLKPVHPGGWIETFKDYRNKFSWIDTTNVTKAIKLLKSLDMGE
jgi:hypothetical protein